MKHQKMKLKDIINNNLKESVMVNTYADLDNINIPTFLLGGKYDGIAPVLNMEKMHQKIRNSKLEFYEGGHLFLMQDTNAFQDIIKWLTH